MKRPGLFLVAVMLVSGVVGCTDEPSATEPTAPTTTTPTTPLPAMCNPYTVTVQAVNGNTGKPIAGAMIYKKTLATGSFYYWGTTSATGEFSGNLGMVGEGVWWYFKASYGGVDSSEVSIPVHPPACTEYVTLTVYP